RKYLTNVFVFHHAEHDKKPAKPVAVQLLHHLTHAPQVVGRIAHHHRPPLQNLPPSFEARVADHIPEALFEMVLVDAVIRPKHIHDLHNRRYIMTLVLTSEWKIRYRKDHLSLLPDQQGTRCLIFPGRVLVGCKKEGSAFRIRAVDEDRVEGLLSFADHHRHLFLYDAGLFPCDLLKRIAEYVLVVPADIGNHGNDGRNDVG